MNLKCRDGGVHGCTQRMMRGLREKKGGMGQLYFIFKN